MKPIIVLLALGIQLSCRASEDSADLIEYLEYFEFSDIMLGSASGSYCALFTPDGWQEIDDARHEFSENPELQMKVHGWHDKNGLRQGVWREWHGRGGVILFQGSFVDDKRAGVWTISMRQDSNGTFSEVGQRIYH